MGGDGRGCGRGNNLGKRANLLPKLSRLSKSLVQGPKRKSWKGLGRKRDGLGQAGLAARP